MFQNLTENNYLLFAAKVYEKPNAIMSEFEEDLNRTLYIKRLLTKYYANGILKDRLIMNHLVILLNVFGVEATARILFFKLDSKDLAVIKPFLIYLNSMPDVVYGINGKDITTSDVKLDKGAIECLRNLKV